MRHFWKAAATNFLQLGALFPSTGVACRTIAKRFPPHTQVVAEYGPGTGVLTHEILKRLPNDGKVFGIELNETLAKTLKSFPDQRFHLIEGDVAVLSGRLKTLDPRGVDVAVSGIPFSFIPIDTADTIVKNTHENLKKDGCFVVYQYSRYLLPVLKKYFRKVEVSYEPRNVFPYFIMVAWV